MAVDPTPALAGQPAARTCPHCGAANRLDLGTKCSACRKRLPAYCFACYAPIASDSAPACEACGQRRWIFGDHTDLPCASEAARATRSQAYMRTRMRGDKVVHEWRCMKCFGEDTLTDAFSHFPSRPAAA
jgi:hypothetical protein